MQALAYIAWKVGLCRCSMHKGKADQCKNSTGLKFVSFNNWSYRESQEYIARLRIEKRNKLIPTQSRKNSRQESILISILKFHSTADSTAD